ncbi:hypothetical protein CO058_02810 [candidate division WWE3 bacterium CG_4_9_14_0_2_um_filter_35_11]|uniref:Polymerase beta nucleotidyltransferase domain-containing protein n=1 Tax=candidate division WWE3 bacterium CG_4_9_14_0_2_um_filter_35_11 TaxID=1975077 RepID=A0A2M8ELF7_UNCKA|nr:MAG: hypothetical protein COV25_04015 [candidate division WWE3 bacterium CG10_big_fil_rev_8_21_14_0_10_35_32]PJC23572.1 MAG: hypothetical protein CO058_02810 [candidate division WWE3 bacterium CG_4_9_14_0_2_um_filter_35_11]
MNQKDLDIIKEIINNYIDINKNKAFIFGSQATGKTSKSSDIDIAIEGPKLDSQIYFEIKNAFDESDLPYKTDIVEFRNVSSNFQKIAKEKIIPINY